MHYKSFEDILCCPKCKSNLEIRSDSYICDHCDSNFNILNGVPRFFELPNTADTSVNGALSDSFISQFFRRIISTIPQHTCWTDQTIFEFMNQLPGNSRILNLGSGSGLFDHKIKIPMLNLDVISNNRTHVVADGHFLPFKDDSFDCVFSNAVLEHVRKPWEVAREMERVTKPGGYIIVNLPFLNTIHDEEDYFRFTLKGIREIFGGCEQTKGGVSSGAGSFLYLCAIQYINLFIPTKFLRSLTYFIWGHIFFRFKWLDLLVRGKQDFAITANSFYFIGRKV